MDLRILFVKPAQIRNQKITAYSITGAYAQLPSELIGIHQLFFSFVDQIDRRLYMAE